VIQEIEAKTLVSRVPGSDRVFGLKYNLNLYRGCEHRCIYCDSRSECYGIENFDRDVLGKVNAIELLEKELASKRAKGPVGFGSMSDPYTPVELRYNLTSQALQVLARRGFPAHLNTKSDLILKDLPLLTQVPNPTVAFTLTTTDDALARKIEPGAPLPSARLRAMQALAEAGVMVGVSMMPVLPFVTDQPENILAIVDQTAAHGGTFIIPWFGMSLRDRQRDYYYARLEHLFPGLRERYERRFGASYGCPANEAQALTRLFYKRCAEYGIAPHIPRPAPAEQLKLF